MTQTSTESLPLLKLLRLYNLSNTNIHKLLTQGTSSPTPAITKPENECPTPATSAQQSTSQDTDWPDAIPVQIPSLIDQSEDQGLDRHQA